MSTSESQASPPSGQDDDPGGPFRRIFGWVALGAAAVWGTLVGGFLAYHSLQRDGWMVQLVQNQFPALILVPMSGLASLCIVLFRVPWCLGSGGPVGGLLPGHGSFSETALALTTAGVPAIVR